MATSAAVLWSPLHELTKPSPDSPERFRSSHLSLDAKHPLTRGRLQTMNSIPTTRVAASVAGAYGKISESVEKGKEAAVEEEHKTVEAIKTELYRALQGSFRGVFGVKSAEKLEIEELVMKLESRNPTPNPTDHLMDKVHGCWKLIYSTVVILGSKRTKLGLRDFINLGDIYQIIDVEKAKAKNVINFNAKGIKSLTGQLIIEALYRIASKTRVNIELENSSITPAQLMCLFQKNYDLLIAIFNPEGWLEITYVDEFMRIGRDDKGNIFVMERAEQEFSKH
ncbi:hypothetical protein HPP92_025917 [Vanilla planifolia]|uniref:Plastid lipid-associated protein/fibrillin conserved domain-containing protein n=1 Tax=Vanilla planifolia TaxID=51239 RepID=A0A835PF76_VANPL|nr:hypothetical protein HPP92_025917 [Vanilla planifolia]